MLRKGKTFAGGAVSKSLKFDRKTIFLLRSPAKMAVKFAFKALLSVFTGDFPHFTGKSPCYA